MMYIESSVLFPVHTLSSHSFLAILTSPRLFTVPTHVHFSVHFSGFVTETGAHVPFYDRHVRLVEWSKQLVSSLGIDAARFDSKWEIPKQNRFGYDLSSSSSDRFNIWSGNWELFGPAVKTCVINSWSWQAYPIHFMESSNSWWYFGLFGVHLSLLVWSCIRRTEGVSFEWSQCGEWQLFGFLFGITTSTGWVMCYSLVSENVSVFPPIIKVEKTLLQWNNYNNYRAYWSILIIACFGTNRSWEGVKFLSLVC